MMSPTTMQSRDRTWSTSTRSSVERFGIYKEDNELEGYNYYKNNSRFIRTCVVVAMLGIIMLLAFLMISDILKTTGSHTSREKDAFLRLLSSQNQHNLHPTTSPANTTEHEPQLEDHLQHNTTQQQINVTLINNSYLERISEEEGNDTKIEEVKNEAEKDDDEYYDEGLVGGEGSGDEFQEFKFGDISKALPHQGKRYMGPVGSRRRIYTSRHGLTDHNGNWNSNRRYSNHPDDSQGIHIHVNPGGYSRSPDIDIDRDYQIQRDHVEGRNRHYFDQDPYRNLLLKYGSNHNHGRKSYGEKDTVHGRPSTRKRINNVLSISGHMGSVPENHKTQQRRPHFEYDFEKASNDWSWNRPTSYEHDKYRHHASNVNYRTIKQNYNQVKDGNYFSSMGANVMQPGNYQGNGKYGGNDGRHETYRRPPQYNQYRHEDLKLNAYLNKLKRMKENRGNFYTRYRDHETSSQELSPNYWNPYNEDSDKPRIVNKPKAPRRNRKKIKKQNATDSSRAENKFPQLMNYKYPKDAKNIGDIIDFLNRYDKQQQENKTPLFDDSNIGKLMKLKGVYLSHEKEDSKLEESQLHYNEQSSNTDPFDDFKPMNLAEINYLLTNEGGNSTQTPSTRILSGNTHTNVVNPNDQYFPRPPIFNNNPSADEEIMQASPSYTTAFFHPLGSNNNKANYNTNSNHNHNNYNSNTNDNNKHKYNAITKKPRPLSVIMDIYPTMPETDGWNTQIERPNGLVTRRPLKTLKFNINKDGDVSEGGKKKHQMIVHLNLYPKKKKGATGASSRLDNSAHLLEGKEGSDEEEGENDIENTLQVDFTSNTHHIRTVGRHYNEDYEGDIRDEDEDDYDEHDLEDESQHIEDEEIKTNFDDHRRGKSSKKEEAGLVTYEMNELLNELMNARKQPKTDFTNTLANNKSDVLNEVTERTGFKIVVEDEDYTTDEPLVVNPINCTEPENGVNANISVLEAASSEVIPQIHDDYNVTHSSEDVNEITTETNVKEIMKLDENEDSVENMHENNNKVWVKEYNTKALDKIETLLATMPSKVSEDGKLDEKGETVDGRRRILLILESEIEKKDMKDGNVIKKKAP